MPDIDNPDSVSDDTVEEPVRSDDDFSVWQARKLWQLPAGVWKPLESLQPTLGLADQPPRGSRIVFVDKRDRCEPSGSAQRSEPDAHGDDLLAQEFVGFRHYLGEVEASALGNLTIAAKQRHQDSSLMLGPPERRGADHHRGRTAALRDYERPSGSLHATERDVGVATESCRLNHLLRASWWRLGGHSPDLNRPLPFGGCESIERGGFEHGPKRCKRRARIEAGKPERFSSVLQNLRTHCSVHHFARTASTQHPAPSTKHQAPGGPR